MLRCRSNTASKTGLEFILSLTLEPIYWAKLMLRSWLRMAACLLMGAPHGMRFVLCVR